MDGDGSRLVVFDAWQIAVAAVGDSLEDFQQVPA